MTSSLYDDILMDHIKHARNYQALENADCFAHGRNPLCGDEMTVYVLLGDGHIGDVAYQASCCGISMASGSIMTEAIKGKPISAAQNLADRFVASLHGAGTCEVEEDNGGPNALLRTVEKFPSRAGCAALPWQTLARALSAGAACVSR
jgi:nitrogen fixation protein NifU and related proteins